MSESLITETIGPTTYREVFTQTSYTLKACWQLSAAQRKNMVFAYVITLLIEICSVGASWMVAHVTAHVAGHALTFRWQDSLPILIGVQVCWLMWGLLDTIRDTYFHQRFRNQLNRDLPITAFKKLLSLSRYFHQMNNTGQLTAKIIRGSERVCDMADLFQHNLLPRTTIMLVIYLFLAWQNRWFLLMTTVLIGLYGWVIVHARTKTQVIYEKAGDLEEASDALMSESVANVLTVQAYHQEHSLIKKTFDLREAQRVLRIDEARINMRARTLRAILSDHLNWLMLIVAIGMFHAHTLTFEMFVFTLGLINRFRDEIVHLGWMYDGVMDKMNGIRRLSLVLEQEPTIVDPTSPKPIPYAPCAHIQFENVSFHYPSASADEPSPWTLQNVTLDIAPGEVMGIAGGSGQGKSTLVSLLLRFADPNQGSVLLNGVDLRDALLKDVRAPIGYVEQEVRLFNDTIGNNIDFGRHHTQAEIEAAAMVAGAHAFIATSPEGYKTKIGDRGMKLSGGQRQRLGIARAILGKPSLLIFDEATSSLDAIGIERIKEALERVKGTCTIILVSHQLSTLQRLADRIAIVRDGRIGEVGTHEQLIKHNGLYRQLVDIQQNHDRNEA